MTRSIALAVGRKGEDMSIEKLDPLDLISPVPRLGGPTFNCRESELEKLKADNESLIDENYKLSKHITELSDGGIGISNLFWDSEEKKYTGYPVRCFSQEQVVIGLEKLSIALSNLTSEGSQLRYDISHKALRTVGNYHQSKYPKLKAENGRLKDVLSSLVDIQNGPPLIRDTENWNEIMKKAFVALGLKGQDHE